MTEQGVQGTRIHALDDKVILSTEILTIGLFFFVEASGFNQKGLSNKLQVLFMIFLL